MMTLVSWQRWSDPGNEKSLSRQKSENKRNSELRSAAGRRNNEGFVLYFTVRSNSHPCAGVKVQWAPGQGWSCQHFCCWSTCTLWQPLLNVLKYLLNQGRPASLRQNQWAWCLSFRQTLAPGTTRELMLQRQTTLQEKRLYCNLQSSLYTMRKRIFIRQRHGSHCETFYSFYFCPHLNELGGPACSQPN